MFRPFEFSDVLFILGGLWWTLILSVAAFAGGALLGLATALARVSHVWIFRVVALVFIRVFQGTPLLMQLFLVYFGLNIFGYGINPWAAASLGLTLHAGAFLGEIWRGCIIAVPKGQTEAATALSLGYLDRMRYVILPQASRIAVAPTVGFLVQLLKGTSLASVVGFVELTRAGQIISSSTFEPLPAFGLVSVLYFLVCWPLSLYAARLERKFSMASKR